ncbi:MAG: hypothetical protein JWN98_1338 [Abditibacteriota bacterium]|nr:hypothetical protein [Abditibacteriota bacterium]
MSRSTLKWPAALVALTTISTQIDSAQAQRERPGRAERREERQQGTQNMTPEQRRTFMQQRMQERMKNMTPEQRQRFQERMQQRQQGGGGGGFGGNGGDGGFGGNGGGGGFGGQGGPGGNFGGAQTRENRQRQVMVASGITDEAVQDAIILFLSTQEKERQPLLEMARQLNQSLANPETTSEQTTAALAAFRAAVAADKTRYDAALQELDAKIRYTTTPKIEAFLTLIGILGNEAPTVGGSSVIFAPQGRGNRAAAPQAE